MAQVNVKFKVIDMPAEFSTITGRKIVTIKNNADWKDYWNRYVTANVEDHGNWKPMPLPAVDFKLNEIVAVHMGTFSDAGQRFAVTSVVQGYDFCTVSLKSQQTKMRMHHVSHPALLIQVPKTRDRVGVSVDGRPLQSDED